MSLDEEIVRDRLFNQGKFGTFKGGGDKVGAALANFINARNDARARALRNREIENRNNQSNGVYANGSGVRVGNTGSEQEGFTPWQNTLKNGGYTFGDAINSADYGNDVKQTSPNKYTFNEEDYIPNAGNGYHLGDYPQTEMYGSPTDYQRQMAANAVGYNIGSFEPRQKKYFNPTGEQQPDNTMNITSQPIGQNYNQSIGSQYKNSTMGGTQGMNVPQSPNGFGQVFQNTENGGISVGYDGKKIDPFAIPTSQDNSVQVEGGANQVPRMRDHFGDSPYLTEDFKYDNWNKRATDAGIDDEISRRVLYEERIKPLIKEARDEELRQAFFALQNPNTSEQDKMNAMALIEYHRKDPFLEENQQMRRDANTMRMQDLQSRITDRNQRSLGDYAGMNLEGQSWVRNGDSVDLSNAQPHTIAGLNHISDIFQQMTGKPLIVTSGNDGDMHAGGQFSHGKGWKIDVSGNGLEDPEIRHAFIQQCQNLGIQVLDEYENPSANSTGGHLDLQFSGYRGNVKARPRNNRNTYTNGTSSYGNTKIKDMTEKEYTGIKTAITKLNEDNSAESAQALIDGLKNEYGRILFKTGSPEKAIKQLHEDLVGGRFGKLNQNEAQIKNIVASAYASVAGGMDERERKKNEEIAMAYLNGKMKEETKEKPQNKEEKKDKKIKPAEFNENVNYNYFPEDELNDSDFGGAIKKASNYQLINLKDPTRESLRGDLENLMTRNTIDRERLDEGY